MRYTFEFSLKPYEIAILKSSGAVLRPSGVGTSAAIIPRGTFGFNTPNKYYKPFGFGTFLSSKANFNVS